MSVNGIEHSGVPTGPDPLRTHATRRMEPSGTEASNRDAQAPRTGRPVSAQDRVEISEAARSLSGTEAPQSVRGTNASAETITADRIRTVLARVSEGFYDRPQQQREIAQKLLPDLRQLTTG